MNTLLEEYKIACDFPGRIDDVAVENGLRKYLASLNINKEVRKLQVGWSLATEPSLSANIGMILADFEKRSPSPIDAIASRASRDALASRDARDALASRDARDAIDARDSRDAIDAREARDALASRASRDALDSRASRDALASRASRASCDALASREALASRDARDALASRDALDARDALDSRASRDAREALASRDARASRDALDIGKILTKRFAAWCIYRSTWWWTGELAWFATTHVGAVQLNKTTVLSWSQHVYDAYIAGAWLLYWTEDILYWIPKPVVKTELVNGRKRLHCEDGPTLECAVENLYFWHGVMVPAFVVTYPQWITIKHIETETNSEVRRIMIERYGQSKFLVDSGAEKIHEDVFGVLYRKEIAGDEPLVMVKVVNSTAEPDGSFKDYFLRVPPTLTTARAAVAWTFGKEEHDYAPAIET